MVATPLFAPNLIDASATVGLPTGYRLRPLEVTDYDKGFLNCLAQLTEVGSINKHAFEERFAYFKKHAHEYYTIVIEDLARHRILAAGTVFVERKFIRGLAMAGHIEDIVVHEEARGHQLGRYIIEALKSIGKNVGCYKIILDCAEKNVKFYEKCGFERKEVEMVLYIKNNAPPKASKL